MVLRWTPTAGSTLVASAAFDEPARRIYVRLHSGEVQAFEDCDSEIWQQFMAPATSKGEYLNGVLRRHASVSQVSVTLAAAANTIFPSQMAATSASPETLVDRYRAVLPDLRRLHRNNQHGTYFGRLVAYDGTSGTVDQLGGLIGKLQRELRSSRPKTARYEVGFDQPADTTEPTTSMPVYVPSVDNAIMGFPCLSLCSFQLDGRQLHMVAHYRSQYLVQRGYGNYLGLARLQEYIARNAGVEPGMMMVVAGRARADVAKYRFDAMMRSPMPQHG